MFTKLNSILVVLFIVVILSSLGTVHAFANSSLSCSQQTISVTLSPQDSTEYHLIGSLCSQGSFTGKTLQLLLHGNTYDRTYWNWPIFPQKYSYVHKATDEGYATFAIDRIGYGKSNHPLSTLITLESDSFVLHQVIQDLHNGAAANTKFSKIILVGHSYGSLISLFEQHTYADANGLILTGFLHQLAPGFATVMADLYPALQDPKFAGRSLPGTYLTTLPRTRKDIFYTASNADPLIIASDEVLKDTVPDAELATATDALPLAISQSIQVPVLLAVGEHDLLFCDPQAGFPCFNAQTILQRESTNFSSHACLEAFVSQNAGHSINLHLNAHEWFEAANDWANRRIGSSVSTPPTQPCQ